MIERLAGLQISVREAVPDTGVKYQMTLGVRRAGGLCQRWGHVRPLQEAAATEQLLVAKWVITGRPQGALLLKASLKSGLLREIFSP